MAVFLKVIPYEAVSGSSKPLRGRSYLRFWFLASPSPSFSIITDSDSTGKSIDSPRRAAWMPWTVDYSFFL